MTLSGALTQPRAGGQPRLFGLSPFLVYGVLVGLVGIGGAVAIYTTQVQPTSQRVQQLQSEVDALNQEIRAKEAALRDRARVEAELRQAEQQRKRLEAVFGSQQDLKVALLMLDRQIRDSGATLLSFKPTGEAQQQQGQGEPSQQQRTEGNQQQRQAQAAQPTTGLVKKVTYEVQLQGTFPQLLAVVRNVERLRLLLNLNNFSLEGGASQAEEGEESRLTMKFTLEAFVPLSPEELAARKQQSQQKPAGQQQDQPQEPSR